MKLRGKIGEIPLLFLVDSGATHNFISQKLVEALGWQWDETKHMRILMGDGHQSVTQGVCRGLKVQFDKGEFMMDAFLFDLEDMDMILGMSWLSMLRETTVDWKKQIMKVNTEQGETVLKGVPREESLLVSVCGLLEEKRKGELDDLSPEQRSVLEELLNKFKEVFEEPKGLPPVRSKEHRINLKPGQEPINVRPYRYAYHQKNEIERQVKELMEAGHVRHSQSAYSSPVILVKKKNNKWRMCVDYRALNKATIPDKFPIPVIEELLDELHGARFFSKLDLRSGYHQVRMRKEDIPKTAFRTHDGHYEYLVMPFGLINAPSTFQALMNEVFRTLLRRGILVFFDDILVYSGNWEEHLKLLENVLNVLRTHSLFANREKCSFGQEKVEYLGHIISSQGVAVDPAKVSSVLEWPVPKNVKGVRGFLGLTGYYRKFIKDYGKIVKPLTELTKKDEFGWNTKAQEAFEALKRKITTAPVLQLPNFDEEFSLECDASGTGIGAILMQRKKPVAYYSKALSSRNLTKSAYERELMAVALAIQHWRPYLLGRKFTVFSDQKSLKQLLQQRITTGGQQNWVAKLLGYNFEIIYKLGKENNGADALSRSRDEIELNNMVYFPVWLDWQQLNEEIHADAKLRKLIEEVKENKEERVKAGYAYKHGVLYYKNRLVIPENSDWIPKFLEEFHATPQGGHSGFYRSYRKIVANLYWRGMKGDVQQYVQACDTCQRQKYVTSAPSGLLQPLPIPERVWEDISIDFITSLPRSRGFEAILVVVDRLTKYCHFVPLKHPYTAKTLAKIFVKEVVQLHGVPNSVVSDCDPLFMSLFWKEFFKMQGTKLQMSTAYHPQSDG